MAKLSADILRTECDPASFSFKTTDELDALDQVVGQERAIKAIKFGIGMAGPGFNIFAMGPSGIGKHRVLNVLLAAHAATEPAPSSWVYVHNFDAPQQPRAIAMKPGDAIAAREAAKDLIREIEVVLGLAMEGDEYRQRLRALHSSFDAQHEDALEVVAAAAESKNLLLEQSPNGFAIIPVLDGEPATPEKVFELPEEEQNAILEARDEIDRMLNETLDTFSIWERDRQNALEQLNEKVIDEAVDRLFADLRERFADNADFVEHLLRVEESLIRDPSPFIETDAGPPPYTLGIERFLVNVVVDCDDGCGAPVIYEDDPTYENLHGRVEYDTAMGGLTTNFTLIRDGSIHQANGGFLLVDARKLLADPNAWRELKRTLYAQEVRVASRSMSAMAPRALSLDPDPIPLNLKVILIGERETYYALRELDPDMDELFKVMADFETHISRTPDAVQSYATFVATIARTESLRSFDRSAVARVVDEGARIAEHAERLSTRMRPIADLLRASDFAAKSAGAKSVTAQHVEKALSDERQRNSRLRDIMLQEVTDQLINIATTGTAVGEVNGLSVLQFGASSFGRPTRISAAVSPGRELIDIEREVDLGGPIHSKGVMLLAGFLAHRYGAEKPLALSATIAFEQSYGPIDGDSASAAETCALLSALAEVPISQSFAMTGAIDQRGRIQAVGGVDAKIEGFFELCSERGLTGEQGVLIPKSNVSSLMLSRPVIDAVRDGQFSVHAIETIDDALQILTGVDPSDVDKKARSRLGAFAAAWSTFRNG